MKACRYLFFLIMAFLLFTRAFAMAEELEDFLDMDLESLLNAEVVTASRRVQNINESPSAISVITARDIKRSGAVDIPDLFRMVPGVDVTNVHGGTYSVSARGFNQRYPRGMLVMIDGRSIYTSFFGGVFWENDEVFLEDIKQIEVIRGPGATMWGANSINGVINIITKDPEEDQGFTTSVKAGTRHFRENVFRYSDTLSDTLSFSFSGGYQEDQGARGVNDYRRVPKVTGRIKYKLSDNSVVQLFAGVNDVETGFDLTQYTSKTKNNIRSNYQMLRWEQHLSDTSQIQLQIYHNYSESHGGDKSVFIEGSKYDAEIQHSFVLWKRNQIVWGANYRDSEIDSIFLYPETDHDALLGFFLQDEIKILDNLKFIAGIKYEENSFTGCDWSPRACILYSPVPDHHLRFSVSRAFRTPSFADLRFHHVQTLPFPLPPVPLLTVVGNQNFEPEEMTAFEAGYRAIFFKKIGFNLELYYNEIDKLPENIIRPFLISWDNEFKAISKGVEISADYPVTLWWALTANYTYQETEYTRANKDLPGTPRHKFNFGSSFTFKNGFCMDVRAHFVDETKWSGIAGDVRIDDYLRLDVRVSQKLFDGKVELSLAGQNLTDKLHPETSDGIGTFEIERLIYGQVTVRFK